MICGYTENNTSADALFLDVRDHSAVKAFAAACGANATHGVRAPTKQPDGLANQ